MAKPSESKKPLEDNDATYKASNSSEQIDEVLNPDPDSDLEAGEESPSTDNDTGNNEVTLEITLYIHLMIFASPFFLTSTCYPFLYLMPDMALQFYVVLFILFTSFIVDYS